MELGIILCCNLSSFKDRYNKYRDALNIASDDIIKRIDLGEQDTLENENEDNKILSEWSQWTKDPKLSHKKSNNLDIDIQEYWRTAMESTKAEIKKAAQLAWEGHLTSLKCIDIRNMDITDIPQDQMEKLTAIVTWVVWIDNMTPTSHLSSILACVKCPGLVLCNMELSEENTRALVTAMRERVKRVMLYYITLDIEQLTKYDGQGCCVMLGVRGDVKTRHQARLRRWVEAVGWTVTVDKNELLWMVRK